MSTINGSSINGTLSPNWIKRALVVAIVGSSSFAISNTVRTTFGSCTAVASISCTIAPSWLIQSSAMGRATAGAAIASSVKTSGRISTSASAYGIALVRRNVFGEAGGDAHSYGDVLTAQAIGNVFNISSTSTAVLVKAHRIRFGRGINNAINIQGQVVAHTLLAARITTSYGLTAYTRAEASVKRAGNSYFNRDGFVPFAQAKSTSSVAQDRTKIIATFGVFDFAHSTASSYGFVTYRGSAVSTSRVLGTVAVSTRVVLATVSSSFGCTVTCIGVKHRTASAAANAASVSYLFRGIAHYKPKISATAFATSNVTGTYRAYGKAQLIGTSQANTPIPGTQYRGQVLGLAQTVSTVNSVARFKGRVTATAVVISSEVFAVANSDSLAPPSRYMIVPYASRSMALTS